MSVRHRRATPVMALYRDPNREEWGRVGQPGGDARRRPREPSGELGTARLAAPPSSSRSIEGGRRGSVAGRGLRPTTFEVVEIVDAVMAPQGGLVAVLDAVAKEADELLMAALLRRQEFHQGNALGVERADPARFGIVLRVHQLRRTELLAAGAAGRQHSQIAVDLLARFGQEGHALVGPARGQVRTETAPQ